MMEIQLDLSSVMDYKLFLRVKSLPRYHFRGRTAVFPDEFAAIVGLESVEVVKPIPYNPIDRLFDYQEDIVRKAIERRKFAIFADCGLGKTLMEFEFARQAAKSLPGNKCVLIVTPLMVIPQILEELERFYGDSLPMRKVRASELHDWLVDGSDKIGITNWEAIREDIVPGRLGALICDESSFFKGRYGKWGSRCIELGRGLEWKLAATGTPAPNDRIEYGNHAVFLDVFPTYNSFLSRYFVNRGKSGGQWELKPHGTDDFYHGLSEWAIFLSNPSVYGWRDHSNDIPEIRTHIHNIDLTKDQAGIMRKEFGGFFVTSATLGGIGSRSKASQLAKGRYKGENVPTNKFKVIRDLVDSWPDESTILWCLYNDEQDVLEKTFPEAHSLRGTTSDDDRIRMVSDFKAGRCRIIISKPKIMGFGLNLQIATRQVFSGLQDSYEAFYQCVKRSNRVGSTRPLNVHIPITQLERPLVENVLRKADRVLADTEEQERIFRDAIEKG